MSNAFPPLPYDVVECILVHTSASSPTAAAKLCLVASWVRNIAIPQLFHTVVLDSYSKHVAFLENSKLTGPQPVHGSADAAMIALGQHVRHLFVDSNGADMYSMYNLCPNLHSLAIPASRLIAFSTSAPRLFPRLRRLTVLTSGPSGVGPALWTNATRVLPYTTLTHLHFRVFPPNPLPLDAMPLLSHLAQPLLSLADDHEGYDHLVQRCPELHMLVLTHAPPVSGEESEHIELRHVARAFRAHNPRMYICPVSPLATPEWPRQVDVNASTEWRREVDAGDGVWARAILFRTTEL
ncbi:hypothetical protein B0H19DRAFT_175252 [Mycena capillaripes]|nr:hypothetical protein B0H19DRAFT_175252 [Mycena capillaripes]